MALIHVSERFLSFQGEGALVGEPTYFIRTAGCHVGCHWCDTMEVWKVKKESLSPEQLLGELYAEGIVQRIAAGRCTLTLTGGSPALQSEIICQFLDLLWALLSKDVAFSMRPICHWLRVECDCTEKWLGSRLLSLKDWGQAMYVNASPKLSNSGISTVVRSYRRAIQYLASTFGKLDRVCYKFPVGTKEDCAEAMSIVRDFNLPRQSCYLMPLADTRERYIELGPEIAALAIEHGVRFGPREHIALYDRKTGV